MLQELMISITHLVELGRNFLLYDTKWLVLVSLVRAASALSAVLLGIVAIYRKPSWWQFATANGLSEFLSILVRNDLNNAQIWYLMYHIAMTAFYIKLARCTVGSKLFRRVIYVVPREVKNHD